MADYNASSIKVLKGLDAVRKRPGMYIGSTDGRGLHHLVWEIVDNSIDEALSGFCDVISVTIHKDNSITISDNGRGIPVDNHESGRSTVEVVFTELHAGGKFDSKNYKTAGGLHGVGASVTNALSTMLKVTIKRNKKIYEISFKNGGILDQPLKEIGTTKQTGTTVLFKPDSKVFTETEFNYTKISIKLKEKAYLIKNLKMKLKDEIINQEEEFQFEKGLLDYLKELSMADKVIHNGVLFTGGVPGIEIEFAFQYTTDDHEKIASFVNNVRTSDGGTHETGLKQAFTKTFNEFVSKHNLSKVKFTGEDIREGLNCVISLKITESILEFEGQTKSKLGTPKAKGVVDQFISQKLQEFLEQNRDIAVKLIGKITESFKAREAARKAREEVKKTKKTLSKEITLSGKLTPAQSKDTTKNELFLVEGDSAGGSAKQGRDRKFQAILPLKGKVLNVEKLPLSKILQNEEIATIIHVIGAGVGKEFNIKKVKYGKVIIMTDADTDGAHIQALILTFIYRYMQELIKEGKVFIALPPLYKISSTKDFVYAWNEKELLEAKAKYNGKYTIQRYKGLGEMNPDQLWDTTMNPKDRKIIQVIFEDMIIAEQRVSTLMGSNVELRRNWIKENIKFTLEDTFQKDGGNNDE